MQYSSASPTTNHPPQQAQPKYNDSLAQRQAQVRSALEELYGTFTHVSTHGNASANPIREDPKLDPPPMHHHRHPPPSMAWELLARDDPTLSLPPLDTAGGIPSQLVPPVANTARVTNDTVGNDNRVTMSGMQQFVHAGPTYFNDLSGAEQDIHDHSLEEDCSSMSSFSLSELCNESSVLEIKSSVAKEMVGSLPHGTVQKGSVEDRGSTVGGVGGGVGGVAKAGTAHGMNHVRLEDNVREYQRQISSLQNENHRLQEEIDVLRADRVLLSPTKYQVELESMRQVAEQVQVEAEEKIQVLEEEKKRMKEEMDQLKMQLNIYNQREKDNMQQGDCWKHLFYSLLEQICLLEESGLRKDASLKMDAVVRDALSGVHKNHALGQVLERNEEGNLGIKSYMERLSKGCGSSNLLDSIVSNHNDNHQDGLNPSAVATHSSSVKGKKSQGSVSMAMGKYVSVGVDTDDLLQSMGMFYPETVNPHVHNILHHSQTVSELQMENAALKGSNEHMKEQLHRYRREIQSYRQSFSRNGSSDSFSGYQYRPNTISSITQMELEQQNAELVQEIKILSENQRVVEEENRKVVQRCVELEAVAEDATDECEELVARLAEADRELKYIRNERDNLLVLHEDYENATTEREKESQELYDEMTEKYNALEVKYNDLMRSNMDLKTEIEEMRVLKEKLHAELVLTKEALESQKETISTLESQVADIQGQQPTQEAKYLEVAKEAKTLREERDHLQEQIEILQKRQKAVADLEDECSRLRNLNGMIKAKIEMANSELSKVKKENESLVRQLESIRSECDAMRIENVSLSDKKTDMEMEMRKYEKEVEDHKSLISRVEKELGKVITLRDEVQKQNISLRKQLEDHENERKNAEDKLEQLQTENTALKSQIVNTAAASKGEGSEDRVTQLSQLSSTVSSSISSPPMSSPNPYFPSPVGVQTPETMQNDIVTPGPWSVQSSVPTKTGQNTPMDSMDDQLERIQAAKERAALILQNISNFRNKHSASRMAKDSTTNNHDVTQTNISKKDTLKDTETFVFNILDSCGKQTMSV